MKTIISFMSIVLLLSCNSNIEPSLDIASNINSKKENPISLNNSEIKPSYDINLGIVKQENNIYDLIVDMKLHNGAHFVSPNAINDFKGKFKFIVEYNDIVKQNSNLTESPLSKEEYDPHPFVNGNINWVKANTTYKQQIKVSKLEDFQVMGYIQFTIEPSCTLEKIPVIIKYQDGHVKFEIFQC